MTMIEVIPAFAIAAGAYVLARLVGWSEESRNKKIEQRKEADRQEQIAALYGRVNKDSTSS